MNPLVQELALACPPEHAFRVWAERTSLWWRVLAWEPPSRLVYSWHLRQDAADATEVEITFVPSAAGTAVTIVHRGWERLGSRGSELRERNVRGWAGLLPAFAAAVNGNGAG